MKSKKIMKMHKLAHSLRLAAGSSELSCNDFITFEASPWFACPPMYGHAELQFAILTNIIHQEWSELSVKDHKAIKGLKTQNLRDHMSEAELIFTALAELSTRQIAESVNATGMDENSESCKKGGGIAKNARLELEQKTGRRVVSSENFLPYKDTKKILK